MFESLKKLEWFISKRKNNYLLAVLVLFFTNIIVIALPWVFGKVIDEISLRSLTKESFINYIWAIIFLGLSEYGFNFLWGYTLFKNAILIEKEYISIIMNKIVSMRMPFFEKFTTGDLMTRATTNLSEIHELMGFGILTLADGIGYGGTIILAMIFLISWKLTMFSVFPYLLLIFCIKIIGKKIYNIHLDNQQAFSELSDISLEAVSGVRVVRAYNIDRIFRENFAKKTEECKNKMVSTSVYGDLISPISRVIMTLNNALSIGIGVVLIRNGELTLGKLVSFTMYLNQLTWPVYAMGEFANILQRGKVSIDRIHEILDEKNNDISDKNIYLNEEIEDIIFDNYSFSYKSSMTKTLDNINISIKKGETFGIVGRTGSGKSTLIKQMLKEYDFGEGLITINGKNIFDIDTNSIMKKIGYVSQENILFSKSIKENIFFGIEKDQQNEEELLKAIKSADFEKDLENLPNGLDTLVGEKGIAVSGGQKQRISIARALIKNPEILILDDSLSAVDAKTEHKIIKNIQNYRKNKTNIIVTHRLSVVEKADNIIVIDDGKIIERGSHDDLMNLRGWYYEQFNTQKLEDNDE